MMDDLIGLIFAVMTTGIRCVRFQSWGGELNIGYQIEETTGTHCAKLGRVFEVHIRTSASWERQLVHTVSKVGGFEP